nr:sporulation protein YqfD [uncultured Mediterraneibacter sp.]
MIRSLLRYLKGYVKICVEGYSPERFLNMCSYHQIYIWGLAPSKNGYEMYMSIHDFRRIKPLAKKTHTKVILRERTGFPFFLFRYRKRKLFFIGLFLCAALLKIYSMFIWDIHFEGNERWPDETLAEYLRSEGISPLMLKSRVDCPGIVKSIRKEYNSIVWVSASIDGSRLKIQVKENEDTYPQGDTDVANEESPTDLIAASDGVITSIVTRSGVPQVHVGDQVKKGDILVLGRVDVVDDSGEVIGYQYQESDADVFADTQITYQDTLPLNYQEKIYDGKKKYKPYVRIGDVTVSVGSTANQYEYCELSAKERQWKVGENFYLPLAWGMKTATSYTYEEKTYSKEQVREKLSRNFKRFCEDLEEKGVQIRANDVKINLSADTASASGTIYLNESIAEEADTEILTIERKETDESGGTDD